MDFITIIVATYVLLDGEREKRFFLRQSSVADREPKAGGGGARESGGNEKRKIRTGARNDRDEVRRLERIPG